MKVLTIFMLVAFFGCSNEPAKSGQVTSDEKLKINVSEKSEINSANITEFSKAENKISIASETREANSKLEYSILGTWSTPCPTTGTAYIELYPDGTEIILAHCYDPPTELTGWSYKYKNQILTEIDSNGKVYEGTPIEWIDKNSFYTLTKTGKALYKRSNKQISELKREFEGGSGGGERQCGYCEGRGTVRCCDLGAFYKPDCLSQSVKVNCMTNNTPCELRVTCCRCKGTGRY